MTELKFKKGIDTQHEVKLESSLVYATWISGTAFGGQRAKLEVGTAFVGNGAKIEIKGESAKGKKLGKIKDIIRNNKYIGEFEIPADVGFGDEVYFEVKLSKNGIDGHSDRIPTHPSVRTTNLKWSVSEARRGDVVTLSAAIAGVRDGTEVFVTIYEYDQDRAHDRIAEMSTEVKDEKIEIKWEYEYHEDTDEIPTETDMEPHKGAYSPPEYFFTVKLGNEEFGLEQESGLLEFKDWVEIHLVDTTGEPWGNVDYKLTLADGQVREGKLNYDGYAREEDIPPGKVKVEFADVGPGLMAHLPPKPAASGEISATADGQESKVCQLLELDDASFHADSAVLLPRERHRKVVTKGGQASSSEQDEGLRNVLKRLNPDLFKQWFRTEIDIATEGVSEGEPIITDLKVLANVLLQSDKLSGQKLLIAGHAATKGSESHNQELSEARAKGVWYLLSNNRSNWVTIAASRSIVLDVQVILTHVWDRYGWDCYPGPIDGISGPLTKGGTRNFQQTYNDLFSKSIKVDGLFGKQTWGAVFDVYDNELAELCGGASKLNQYRNSLSPVGDADPILALGRQYPIRGAAKANYRSVTSNRVEVMFFEPPQAPTLKKAADLVFEKGEFSLQFLKLEQLDDALSAKDKWGELSFEEVTASVETDEDFEGEEYESVGNIVEDDDKNDFWSFLDTLDDLPASRDSVEPHFGDSAD